MSQPNEKSKYYIQRNDKNIHIENLFNVDKILTVFTLKLQEKNDKNYEQKIRLLWNVEKNSIENHLETRKDLFKVKLKFSQTFRNKLAGNKKGKHNFF